MRTSEIGAERCNDFAGTCRKFQGDVPKKAICSAAKSARVRCIEVEPRFVVRRSDDYLIVVQLPARTPL
jgi:hypothetical protein